MNYSKKYHYMLKYFILALPFILIIILIISNYRALQLSDISQLNDLEYEYFLTDIANDAWYSCIFRAFRKFYELPINEWYFKLLEVIGFTEDSNSVYLFLSHTNIVKFMLYYPLYVFWVYIFDLVVDVFCLLPKLGHKLMDRLGGDHY